MIILLSTGDKAVSNRQSLSSQSLSSSSLICTWKHCDILLLAAPHFTNEEIAAQRGRVTCPRSHSSQKQSWERKLGLLGFTHTFLPIIPPWMPMHRTAGDAKTISPAHQKERTKRVRERERKSLCSEILTKYFCKCSHQPSFSRRLKLWPARILLLRSKYFLYQPGKKCWRGWPKK